MLQLLSSSDKVAVFKDASFIVQEYNELFDIIEEIKHLSIFGQTKSICTRRIPKRMLLRAKNGLVSYLAAT